MCKVRGKIGDNLVGVARLLEEGVKVSDEMGWKRITWEAQVLV